MSGRARNTDPATSKAAAKKNFNATGIAVLRCCLQRFDEGANWTEAWRETGEQRQSISPRWTELLAAGLVERRRTEKGSWTARRGESGSFQIVHWITPAGIKWLDIEDTLLGPMSPRIK